MSKNRLLTSVVVTLVVSSIMLGFCNTPLSSALAPTENANPVIIYWPHTFVTNMVGGYIWIEHGWINARSVSWSPSGKYLLIYGEVYQTSKNTSSVQGPTMLIVDMTSGELTRNFPLWQTFYADNLMRPVFSSDETRIFYVNGSVIRAINLDGSSSTDIVEALNNSASFMIKPISIDVTREGFLIYSVCEQGYDSQGVYYRTYIWKYDLVAREKSLIMQSETRDLQELRDKLITSLRVSPSDEKIAFTTCKSVYIMNLDGTDLRKIANASNQENILSYVDWTPTGETLTFSEFTGVLRDWGLEVRDVVNTFAVNLDGSNKHVIPDERYYLPKSYGFAWSPVDSSMAAYIMRAGGYNPPYLIDFDRPITPNPDSDDDGMPDLDEIRNFLCPLDPTDANADYDNDGLINVEEITHGTYIGNPDSDDDGLSDGVEVKVFKTDPTKRDTDGDGVSDGLEAAATGLNAFVSVLPDGWIRIQLEWKDKIMYISTNSSVLGVVFDSTNMALTVSVGGPDGTVGVANITIPVDMISSLSAVRVTLDNQPINFEINQVGNYAQIHVQYHHSYHELTTDLNGGGGIGGVDLSGLLSYWWLILSIGIVAVASIIALIMVRRK